MKTLTAPRCILVCAALGGAWTAVQADSSPAPSIVSAIRRGDCDKAVKLANDAMISEDAQVDFLAARMSDEGVCVTQNSAAATDYYKRSLQLGNRAAALDYGAKIGLGQGVPQDYEKAGENCRAGGLDAAGQVSTYTLGYACTVRALVGQMLRESLPKGAIRPGGGAALVTFTPASGALQIRTLPGVVSAAPLGTHIGHPVVDAHEQIQKTWVRAMAEVPKADPARLEGKAIDLTLDVEMTIEQGRDSPQARQGSILAGEVQRRTVGSTAN